MTELPIQGILLQVLSQLEAARIPYMIMGGFAVRAIGVPRPTYDADLTIEASDPALIRLFEALGREGFIVPEEFRKGFRDSVLEWTRSRSRSSNNSTSGTSICFSSRPPTNGTPSPDARTSVFSGLIVG